MANKKPEQNRLKIVNVKVTWNFDYPVDVKDETYKFDAKGLIIQEVFDGLTMYVIRSHIRDASHWLAESKCDEKSPYYKNYQHHNIWYDTLEKSETSGGIKYNITLPEKGSSEAKVEIIWDFDLPVFADDVLYEHNPKGYVQQLVSDDVTRYPLCKHLVESMEWLSKSKEDKKSTAYHIYKHHKDWADLLKKVGNSDSIKYDIILPK